MKRPKWRNAIILNTSLTLTLLASQAFAATTFSVDFLGRITGNTDQQLRLDPTAVAGVVPAPNWNEIDDYNFSTTPEVGQVDSLIDSTGTGTSVSLVFEAQDSWNNDTPTTLATNSANALMMQGILKANNVAGQKAYVIFTNVPEGQYDMYVYLSMNGDNVACNVSDLDRLTTYYIKEVHQFYATNSFVQGTNTDPNGVRDTCSYVKLSNVGTYGSGEVGAIITRVSGGDGAGISGAQLVNIGAAVVNTNPVSFLASPQSRRVLVGDTNVTLSVTTRGPVASLQWNKNGSAISGATDASYLLPAIASTDAGAQFTVTASNNVNKVTSAPGVITIGKLVTVPGIDEKLWFGATRATIEDGSHDAVTPDKEITLGVFESPNEQGDNFAERLSGIFIAPVTTNYVFFVSSDDDSDMFVSTDATPAKKVLVAQEVDWANPLAWVSNDGGTANNQVRQKRSDTWVDPATSTAPWSNGIPMVKGSQYYIEVVHHEGGGGDEADATFKMVGEPDPQNGDHSRINAFNLAPAPLALDGGWIAVTNPPADASAIQSLTATFTVAATSGYIGDSTGVGPSVAYQWQVAPAGSSTFTSIPGANGTSYTTPILTLADSGSKYRVTMLAGDAATNSAAATLTVTADTTPPRPVAVSGVLASGFQLNLSFDEKLDKASAETAANYVFNPGAGSITATNASLDSSLTVVTIKTGTRIPPTVTNILAITGVKDLAGNPAAANTTISFSYTLVTYEADIEFDQPIAYFRFEDATTSSVAHNSGTSGIEGAYYLGDEASAGAGGVSTNASGDAGPRPPTFAGFDANNHSAKFTGAPANGANGEWVDAKSQYLQGLPAFSLEYWCNPMRTNSDGTTWGNRIGLVGQNDAIEYGFIDPGTIQIWTPNGGSLNTTYSFLDGEWHHIATIADGTTLKNYYDGALVGTGGAALPAGPGGYGTSTFNVHIGGGGVFDGTGNYFVGNIDEVAIFNKAIPAARIAEHFNAGKSGGVVTISGAVTPVVTPPGNLKLSISAPSGGSINISWSPTGGTLQKTSQLLSTGTVWTDAGTANPTSVPVGATPSFFRVKQ